MHVPSLDPPPPRPRAGALGHGLGQRDPGYRGGVQPGTTAASSESTHLETALREATTRAQRTHPDVAWRKGYTRAALADHLHVPAATLTGIEPDGGIWSTAAGTPLLAVEAKKQGERGNAIERWYKNLAVAQALDVRIYLTICTGEGFFDGNSAQRTLQTALALDPHERERLTTGPIWNHPTGRIWLYRYRRAEDATPDRLDTLLQAALTHARTHHP